MLYCNPAATPTRHSAQQAQQACMASCVDVLILIVLSQYIPAPICHWFVTVHFFLTVGRARRLRAKFSHIFHGGWFHWDYLWDYPAHSMWSQVWVLWISRTVAWLAIAMDSWPDMTMPHDLYMTCHMSCHMTCSMACCSASIDGMWQCLWSLRGGSTDGALVLNFQTGWGRMTSFWVALCHGCLFLHVLGYAVWWSDI